MDASSICHFIRRRYAEAYGASPLISYDRLLVCSTSSGGRAALGYRRASQERLFLEDYLDVPIDAALEKALGRPVLRHDIVEIGNLAADNAAAMVELWAQTANDLGREAEIAVAVLTAQLRQMFRRLGLTLHEIAAASPGRLNGAFREWGEYYDHDPIICAGFIAEGQTRLSSLMNRRQQRPA